MRLLIATTNPNKIREITRLLAGAPVDLITLDAWPSRQVPEETGQTFEQNARAKAEYYARATGELTVAEDSGLEIDALGGRPGIESARYAGVDATYPQKFTRLYEELRLSGDPNRTARFVCALALATPLRVLFETRGTIEGLVAAAPSGDGGFGYDPIFFYPPYGCTLGEATIDQKAVISHRGQAFRALRGFLEAIEAD